MIFIIGGNGYVGQAYRRLFDKLGRSYQIITRDNYASFAGQSCELLINANGNSRKFVADRDPISEFDASVTSVVRSLEAFPAERYVLLSSGDVYPRQETPEMTREDALLDTTAMSRYGLHKCLAETIVRSLHPNHLIIRMGGFVGPGMKKNAIFDLLNDQPIWLDRESRLQFISTDTAAGLVWSLVERREVRNETVNLGAVGTVRIGDLYDRVAPASDYHPDARHVIFEISTDKLALLVGHDLPTSEQEVDAFLAGHGR